MTAVFTTSDISSDRMALALSGPPPTAMTFGCDRQPAPRRSRPRWSLSACGARGLKQSVGTLSGGNQQKVVIARWLTGDVKVLLLDEPTRGVDVGARSEIYKIISDLAAAGMAVVMASSDMPEILGLSHRAFVMRAGTVAAELDRSELDHVDVQASIFRFAAGLESTAETALPADHVEHHLPTDHSPHHLSSDHVEHHLRLDHDNTENSESEK